MIHRMLALLTLAWNSLWNQLGAFAITNRLFATGDASYLPACHNELADQTLVAGALTTAAQNTGVVGLKWIRVKFNLKTLGSLAATNFILVTIQAGTGAAVTAPENILQIGVRMETGDLTLTGQGMGWSQNGFQSYKVIMTTYTTAGVVVSTTAVLDVMVDCG